MLFTIQPKTLKRAIASMSIKKSSSILPIYDNILLTRGDDDSHIRLTTSDGDITVTATIEIEDFADIRPILIPSERFVEFVKASEVGLFPMNFSVENSGEMTISDEIGNLRLMCSNDYKEFPVSAILNDPVSFDVPSSLFVDDIYLAVRYTSNDELRPVMTGVCCEFMPDGLRVVSSDSKRMFFDMIRSVQSEGEHRVILSKKFVTTIKGLCSTSADDVINLSFDGKMVVVSQRNASGIDELTITHRLIDGKYPRYEAVIPKSNHRVAVIDRKKLSSAVTRVGVAASDSTQLIKLSFDGADKLTLEAKDFDFSTSSTLNIQTTSQDNLSGGMNIGVRGSNFKEILETISGPNAVLLMSEPSRAILVKEAIDADRLLLIMPMMLND